MFTKTDLENLMRHQSRDAVAAAVERIPEEDLRFALVLSIMNHKQTIAVENELWCASFVRYSALEEEVEKLRNRASEV